MSEDYNQCTDTYRRLFHFYNNSIHQVLTSWNSGRTALFSLLRMENQARLLMVTRS